MIVVLSADCGESDVAEVLSLIEARGLQGRSLPGTGRPMIHVFGGPTRRARRLSRLERVDALIPTSGPRVRREGRRFFPYHFLAWGALFMTIVGVLVFLAGSFPPGLGSELDVRHAPEELGLPPYLRPLVAWFGLFPSDLFWVAWLGPVLLFALVAALPLLDRTTGRGLRGRLHVVAPGAILLALAVYLALGGGLA